MHSKQVHIPEFIALIRQSEKIIYKVCSIYTNNAEDNKDLFQEIVIQIWTAYPRFQQNAKISTWLYRIALNTAISHKRKSNKLNLVPIPGFMTKLPQDSLSPPYSEEVKILQQLIGGLPALEKALILLYLEDNSYQEIADIMGISLTNVGTKLGRIKDKLKKQAQPFINN